MDWIEFLRGLFRRRPTPQPPQPPPQPPVEVSNLVAAINAERSRHNLPPFREDPRLTAAAQAWAQNMASMGILFHGDFMGRITAAVGPVQASENIGEGYETAGDMARGWMESPGHQANMLGSYNAVGVGRSTSNRGRNFWCANFARL
jgi:uncharacterized protein YkwD